ncbi:MAG: hypothetical protein MZV70_16125 [Desulfobacterales bacterium]|nr:hypothetical protein [Desulfobacterales bacterium]
MPICDRSFFITTADHGAGHGRGIPHGLCAVAHDRDTDRQGRRGKKLMDQKVVETGKLASIGELAAGVAHEINNPVAIMVEEAGWIGDLLEEKEFQDSKNLEEFKRALAQIQTQGRRCKDITFKLLSFARKTAATVQDIQINYRD